jgi:hypothetical protein
MSGNGNVGRRSRLAGVGLGTLFEKADPVEVFMLRANGAGLRPEMLAEGSKGASFRTAVRLGCWLAS